MGSYYWDESKMKLDAVTPTILAIGDSWFWYPFPGGSLVNNLGPMVAPKSNAIYAKGMNGAEAYDYVDGKYRKVVREALRLYGSGLKGVFISGGGNDFAGFNDMRPLLKDTCTAETTAAGCFRDGPDGLPGFLDRIDTYYRRLIGVIYTYTPPGCKIVMHTYDYAIPDGRGVGQGAGWLKPALEAAGVAAHLQTHCVRLLIDQFAKTLDGIAKMDPANLLVVHSEGTLAAADWANELHPTGAGFRKIAKVWEPTLRDAGLA